MLASSALQSILAHNGGHMGQQQHHTAYTPAGQPVSHSGTAGAYHMAAGDSQGASRLHLTLLDGAAAAMAWLLLVLQLVLVTRGKFVVCKKARVFGLLAGVLLLCT